VKIDKERLESKMFIVRKNMKKLGEFQDINLEEFLADHRNYDSAKYNLQVSIEALIDIGNHIIARESFEVPKTNADTFRILADNDFIPEEKLDTYISMARFRNKVVHLYDEIDEAEIYQIINENLADFDAFIKAIFKRYFQ